ncbi:MAG: hypothetical protein ACYTBZ_29910, partial [Planctomycetota bacterium]
YEVLDFGGKAITVTNTDPNDWTVVALTENDANDPNEYVVTFENSEDANSVLKGFVITGGDLGIYCDAASPTISNCVITQNGSGIYQGAGLYDCNGASPAVIDCFFTENDANNGGAIYNIDSAPTIKNCVIAKNSATVDGGGIYDANSSPTIINCTFNGNSAGDDGGAMYNDTSSSPLLTNCIIWGNNASGSGDDVYNSGSADPNFSYCDIKGCGGSGGGWNSSFGTDGGGNVDGDPNFIGPNDPAGPDDILGTFDDGLRPEPNGACLDAADGNAASSTDISGRARSDFGEVANIGVGDPNYAEIGAYESPVVLFVDKDATGSDNGSSWADAFDDLQDALADANSGDEIWVAEGTYKPTSGSSRLVSFELAEGAALYGGFAGTEASRHPRDWKSHETILSGDISEPNDSSDNSYHVVEGADGAILDGFTVTGGNADGSGTNRYGGGMYNYSCSVTVRNCVFTENAAVAGGGMYVQECTLTLTDCVFPDNTAEWYGGGIDISDCSPTITNCVFTGNVCEDPWDGYGGAIDNFDKASPIITNCTFFANIADYGGALSNSSSTAKPKLINCIFWNNSSNQSGDEVYNYGSADPNFRHCDVNGCGGSGGGWDSNFGTDGGGNIDSDPCFAAPNTPAGSDGAYGTVDDGLHIMPDSPCVDAGDGDAAPSTDLLGLARVDVADVNNTGTGTPDYVDMGVYESGHDSDYDGMPDEWEIKYGLDPADSDDAALDADSDGLKNLKEYWAGTDPTDSDSDNDGMPDGWEVDNNFDPLDSGDASEDADSDGLSNVGEYTN